MKKSKQIFFFSQQIIVFKKDISSLENCNWKVVSELTKTLQKVTKCSACLWLSVPGNKLIFCLSFGAELFVPGDLRKYYLYIQNASSNRVYSKELISISW